MEERQEMMSKKLGRVCSTFTFNMLGQTIFFTSDPENIKALLATQFGDFELGPLRRAIMGKVLGDGIVSSISIRTRYGTREMLILQPVCSRWRQVVSQPIAASTKFRP